MKDIFNIKLRNFTKLDAIQQQLDISIELFFRQKSIISIYTLCSASLTMIRDLAKEKAPNFENEMKEIGKNIGDPSYTKYANFFKHADNDPDDIINFHEAQCCLKLMIACIGFKRITGKRSKYMDIYLIWMFAFFNDLFFLDAETKNMFERSKLDYKINIDNITFNDAKLVGLNMLKNHNII